MVVVWLLGFGFVYFGGCLGFVVDRWGWYNMDFSDFWVLLFYDGLV